MAGRSWILRNFTGDYHTGGKLASGDPGLDSVLLEIDLRVAVELTNAGVA